MRFRPGAFTASGGLAPYSFSIGAGALPQGLTLDAATGVLSGAPLTSGAFSFEVRATDSIGCAGSNGYVLTINCPTINIEPANSNLPNGAVGTAYSQTFSATGGVGAYAFDVVSGTPMSALLLQGGEDKRLPAMGGFEEDFSSIKISFQAKVDSWRLILDVTDGLSNTLFGAPARVQSMRYTNPTTGHVVISVFDPTLPHKWPEWNFMGAIWDFFERAPTR